MKKVLVLLCFMISASAFAQKLPYTGLNRVRIVEADQTILAEINEGSSNPSVKPDLFYYWYSANAIHATQGGYSGKLLNGPYTEFYLNKNLKEQGSFKKGLKDGIWKSWKEDGTLSHTFTWKNGRMVVKTQKPFWKKLNIFKRKAQRPAADSLSKPK
jgi:antitoxin component YwqK of YwqJK toxin-antitoxin module